jgi:hypothetical protein
MDHMIKEAVEIRLHLRNFNRDGGFTLGWSWHPVSNMLKQYRDTPIQRPPIGLRSDPNTGSGQVYIYMGQFGSTVTSALMMGTEMVPEMSVIFKQLTWLVAREDFIILL